MNFTPQQKQDIEKIIGDYINRGFYKLPKLNPHKHDGVDNIPVHQSDVVPSISAMGNRVRFDQNQTYNFYYPSATPHFVLFNGYALQNTSVVNFTFANSIPPGSTSALLSSLWTGSTSTFLTTFSTGETRAVTFTNNSLTATWTVPLSVTEGTSASYQTAAAYALVNGNATIDSTFEFQPNGTTSVKTGGTVFPYPIPNYKKGNTIGNILAQSSSNTYLDPTNVANMTAHLDANFIVNVYSNTNGNIATAQLFNPTKSSIQLQVTNLNGWHILGDFTFI